MNIFIYDYKQSHATGPESGKQTQCDCLLRKLQEKNIPRLFRYAYQKFMNTIFPSLRSYFKRVSAKDYLYLCIDLKGHQ